MPTYLEPIFISAALLCAWFFIAWKWFKLLRTPSGELPSRWRIWATTGAVLSVAISTGLDVYLLVHAAYTGGYPYYHPVEMFCLRYGSLTAMLGVVGGAIGRAKLRLAVTLLSLANFLLWFMDAMAQ